MLGSVLSFHGFIPLECRLYQKGQSHQGKEGHKSQGVAKGRCELEYGFKAYALNHIVDSMRVSWARFLLNHIVGLHVCFMGCIFYQMVF